MLLDCHSVQREATASLSDVMHERGQRLSSGRKCFVPESTLLTDYLIVRICTVQSALTLGLCAKSGWLVSELPIY